MYKELGLLLSVGLEYGIKPLSEESRAKLFWSDWLFLGWGQILIHEMRGFKFQVRGQFRFLLHKTVDYYCERRLFKRGVGWCLVILNLITFSIHIKNYYRFMLNKVCRHLIS